MTEVVGFLDPKNPHRVQDISAIGIMSAQHTCSVCGENNIIENWLLGEDGKKIDPVVWTSLKRGALIRGGRVSTTMSGSQGNRSANVCASCILANILSTALNNI